MKLLATALAMGLLSLGCTAHAEEWEVIEGCRLIDNRYNDGDSFHVKADGEERIFRLYFVDCPEAEEDDGWRKTYDGLEARARRNRLGAWGDSAATPTMEISNGSGSDKPQTNEGPDLGLPSLSDVLSSDE